jgi:hypothetical protein
VTLVANFGREGVTTEVKGIGAVMMPAMDVEIYSHA